MTRRLVLPAFPLARTPRWLSLRRLAAALLATGALLLAIAPAPPPPTRTIAETQTTVLVAARDLPAGRPLAAGDLHPAERTSAQLPDGALTATQDVMGRVVTGAVRRGEVITDLRLLGPGLSASLGSGVVASPVRLVDLDIASLLRPGDRIDILAATQNASTASVVAAGAVVLAIPLADGEESGAATPVGLVVVAVTQDTAAQLAAAGASSSLTATLLPPLGALGILPTATQLGEQHAGFQGLSASRQRR